MEAATNVYLILDIKTALSRNSCVGVRLHLLLSWEPLGSQLLLNEHPTWGCSAWAQAALLLCPLLMHSRAVSFLHSQKARRGEAE